MTKEEISKNVGRRIKLARTMMGKNQREFAEMLGVGVQGLSQMETGRRAPSNDILAVLTEATGFSAAWFHWTNYKVDPDTIAAFTG